MRHDRRRDCASASSGGDMSNDYTKRLDAWIAALPDDPRAIARWAEAMPLPL
jgi:hypothetical protein